MMDAGTLPDAPATISDARGSADASVSPDARATDASADAQPAAEAGTADVTGPNDGAPEATTAADADGVDDRDAARDPNASEGLPFEPVDITGSLPYDGFRGTRPSYYLVTGLVPNTIYTITLTMLEGRSGITVENATGNQDVTCTSDSIQSVVHCAALTDDLGNLTFSTWRATPSEPVTYRVDIAEGGVVNDGYYASPMVVTSIPLVGGVLTSSYYVVSGLVPEGAYTVGPLPNASLALGVYPTQDYFGTTSICALLGTSASTCVFQADDAGNLYLRTSVNDHNWGIAYTIPITPGGYPNQGWAEMPKDLTGSLPFDGSVHQRSSYYRITGLDAGGVYTLTLTGVTDQIQVEYLGLSRAELYPDCAISGSGPSLTCAGHAASDGSIHVIVDGNRSADGTAYTVDLTPGGIPNEGLWTSFLDVTNDLPHAGSVHIGASFYQVTGLQTDRSYTVSLTGLSRDVELRVYDVGQQTRDYACGSNTFGLVDETCDATTLSGVLQIEVWYYGTPSGATFNLDVQEKPPTDGG